MRTVIPQGYRSNFDVRQTEVAIKKVKDFFERDLAIQLNLTRVSAPLFVQEDSGLNDNLNGVERPVDFEVQENPGTRMEIVHSLAKWKRMALGRYGFNVGEGLYTDMNAIRRDEDTDNLHSVYVDQWDWEKIITKRTRTVDTLKKAVNQVYRALKHTELFMSYEYPFLQRVLPEKIHFITAQELEDLYPNKDPRQREYAICKKYGAVFIMQIGGQLKSGIVHDGRAPDYDDWSLNGDILVYYSVLDCAFELSSMGIRVDEDTLLKQLEIRGCKERKNLPFHAALLAGNLPYTIGGGIGQSRICMFFLKKAHIGEVQSSVWTEEAKRICEDAGLDLL